MTAENSGKQRKTWLETSKNSIKLGEENLEDSKKIFEKHWQTLGNSTKLEYQGKYL